MKRDTARLIVTLDCPKTCKLCCNRQQWVIDQARHIDDLSRLREFGRVVLTGGEPMMYPDMLLGILHALRDFDDPPEIYLYSARYTHRFMEVLPLIDGVTFSLHAPFTSHEVTGVFWMERAAAFWPRKSYRLWIEGEPGYQWNPEPRHIWSRITVGPMLENCPLPPNEELFILGG